MRVRAWQGYLLAGLLVIGGAWLLPGPTGLPPVPTRVACYELLSLAVVVAILVGVRRHRPDLVLPWCLLAAARAVYVAGDLTFYTNALVFHDPRFPSLADVFYLGQYPLVAAGLLLWCAAAAPGGTGRACWTR